MIRIRLGCVTNNNLMKKEWGYRRSKFLTGSRTNIRSFGISNHVKKENCPKCGRFDAMTTDYYGDVMCGKCLLNSL
jgi:ribosomal protein S27AE